MVDNIGTKIRRALDLDLDLELERAKRDVQNIERKIAANTHEQL